MQATVKNNKSAWGLWDRIKQFSLASHPAAGWFKAAGKEKRKPRPQTPKVMSPDSVHLRAGAKRDPLRKNPAP